MSERGYCTNCGELVRSGIAYCVSWGTSLAPRSEESGPTNPVPTHSERRSPFDRLLDRFRQGAGRLEEAFSSLSAGGIRLSSRRAVEWLRDLSSVTKLVVLGTLTLILLVLLSPLAVLICALLCGASVIALIVRVAQRGSVKGWAITAVVSLACAFAFVGISDALYGTGYLGNTPGPVTETDSGDGGQSVVRGVDDPSDQAGSSRPASRVIEGSIPAGGPSYPVPDYQVIDYFVPANPATGSTTIGFQVSTVSLGEADLRGIAEDFAVTMTGYNDATLLV